MILKIAVASFDRNSMISVVDYAKAQEAQDCKAGILEQQQSMRR
jgi:hypothetical protein